MVSLSSCRSKQVLFQSKLPQIIHVTMAHSVRCFRNRAAFLQLQFFRTPSQYRLFTISMFTTEPMNRLPKYLHLSLGLHLLSCVNGNVKLDKRNTRKHQHPGVGDSGNEVNTSYLWAQSLNVVCCHLHNFCSIFIC